MSILRALLGGLAALLLTTAASAAPVDTGHLTAELGAEARGIAPGQTIRIALRQKIQKGWHTYWRNAGDSGEATRIAWTLPARWTAGGFVWPAPERLPVGPLMNYGYEGEVVLPLALTAPADAKVGSTVRLAATAQFLVCSDICVPEQAALALDMPVTAAPAAPDPAWRGAIAKALASAPQPAALAAAFQRRGGSLQLAVAGPALKGVDAAEAYFYPYASAVLDHAKPQSVERGAEGVTLTLAAAPALPGGAPPTALEGALVVAGHAYEVSAAEGPPPAGASGLGGRAAVAEGFGLPVAALYALLGGVVLNLMPCVFPILAMKAASLAGHAHDRGEAQKQGLAFGVGAVATFLALAGVLIALQAAGGAVGWGFQLQSPAVVAGLAILMLLVAMNLSGVFEVGTSLQGVGSGLASRGGLTGAFFTGALAVVVAAPCTAPFMGPAIGWALTQPPAASLTVFAALGIGFALPFVLVAFAPGLLARLPRPGPWMGTFKKALAFPMYGAAAWLVWVLTQQADALVLARVLAALVVVAAAAWVLGMAQKRHAAGARPLALGTLGGVMAAVAVAAAVWPEGKTELPAEPYSAERLAALRAEGKPVFVNYTAAWCVSCQVNDRVAITTSKSIAAFRKHGVVYLKADWTKRDPLIAADLARFGRAGVPLYLVYDGERADPAVLPAILTEGVVTHALAATASTSVASSRYRPSQNF